jgi:hypothetical protein
MEEHPMPVVEALVDRIKAEGDLEVAKEEDTVEVKEVAAVARTLI